MTNLDSILKVRDISLLAKVPRVKAMVFPIVMYGCESGTIKKAEHWRIDAFELSCWRRLLRVPWTGRRSNQSILKKINPEYSLEGLMLKLKLQYFGHLMWTAHSLEKALMLGKIEAKERRQQRMKWLDSITSTIDMNLSRLWERLEDKGAWDAAVRGFLKSQTWLSDWADWKEDWSKKEDLTARTLENFETKDRTYVGRQKWDVGLKTELMEKHMSGGPCCVYIFQ